MIRYPLHIDLSSRNKVAVEIVGLAFLQWQYTWDYEAAK